ncbi:hybrid sensor histidine kinase/response regulator [Caldilinea sp.]|uniref:hybrid sensor histidine kinase/response regulator n=1 Tax=Caldilinea sp. TaxID=2293560 RepID=UPI0031CC4578
MQQLLTTFAAEAQEYLHIVSHGVLALEKQRADGDVAALLAEMFRAAHSLKGAARAVGATDIANVAHALESVMGRIRSGDLHPDAAQYNLLYQTVDALSALVNTLLTGVAADVEVAHLIDQLTAMAAGAAGEASLPVRVKPTAAVAAPDIEETSVRAAHRAALVVATVPLSSLPPSAPTPAPALTSISSADESVRVATGKLDAIIEQVGELQVAQLTDALYMRRLQHLIEEAEHYVAARRKHTTDSRFSQASNNDGLAAFTSHPLHALLADMRRVWSEMQANYRHEAQLVDGLEEAVLCTRLMPVATVLESFPRMVRDLARALDKQVHLTIEGDETEIDRSVLEQIKAPLTHLLRNAVDHGIEAPAARTQGGKPAEGNIALRVAQRGSTIVIDIADDGAGIDCKQVRASAIQRGVIDAVEAGRMSEQDLLWLIFRSGMSTRPEVTDVSGRGVGLDVVRDQVERLRGYIDVASTPGQGARFSLHLPLSVATTLCLLVESSTQIFAVPTSGLLRVTRVPTDAIGHAEGREVVHIGERVFALHDLSDLLALPAASRRAPRDGALYALLLGVAEQRVAIAVDAVREVQELIVKPLPQPIAHVQHIAGASTLGAGEIALVLNVAELARATNQRTERQRAWRSVTPQEETPLAAPAAGPAILVADDSFTTRSLERNILETAGYQVCVAADGLEAWTLLQSQPVDLVVSDVLMPHMTGFDLTCRIRGDKRFANLPVILVTAQEAPEDRERGLAAGADAYLVKSAFDQDALLSTVARLI